ncbi:MAG: alpha/beta hydrolase, partial [Anaerolineae bacterium]|nr:alpha/beta hydrolase [Anaerolineae bacterium]
MGGYASLAAAEKTPIKGIFLLAPALYLSGYQVQDFTPKAETITIVHGWNDATAPVENSIQFAKKHRATLHILDSDHRLYSVLRKIEELFT